MLERSVLCKHLVMFYLLITVLFLLFSGCTQAPTVQIALTPSKIIVTTPRQQVVPTATVEFCGVGLVDHYVRMWVQGQGAQIVCDSLVVAIRREGEQPTIWDGQLLENATSYEPVCSDRSSLLGYEVIDTGGHTYGTSWCQWMVSTYGASGSITDPDLFNIVSPAQQAENAQMETQIAAPYAPIESQQTAYAIACIEHNGYIATNGFGSCRVDYPGALRQEIPLNPDGTWDEAMAEGIREVCEGIMPFATAAAKDGQSWSELPQYHPDTGVCVQGTP